MKHTEISAVVALLKNAIETNDETTSIAAATACLERLMHDMHDIALSVGTIAAALAPVDNGDDNDNEKVTKRNYFGKPD